MRIAFVDLNNGKRYGEPNIGLLELASYIQNKVRAECEFFGEPYSILKDWERFDVIAFSAMGLPLEYFLRSRKAEMIKKIPRLKVFGGTGPSIIPQKALMLGDVVVLGEGEIPFLKLIKLLQLQNLSKENTLNVLSSPRLKDIENLAFLKSGRLVFTMRKIYAPGEIEISKIDWSLIKDFETYVKHWRYLDYLSGVRGVSMITARSCPYNCSFCQPTVKRMFGPRLKMKKIDFIIEELLFLRKHFGVNAFMFHDDTFTVYEKRTREICNQLIALRKKGIEFKWICNTRADRLNDSLASLMRDSGCVEVRLGIETFNEDKRNNILLKGLRNKEIMRAIEIIKKNKMKALGFFMIGLPGDNAGEIFKDIVKLVKSPLDLASISVLTPLPGTKLGEEIGVDSFDSYYHSNPHKVSDLNRVSLEFFRILALLMFYFYPKRVLTTIKEVLNMRTFVYKFKRIIGIA